MLWSPVLAVIFCALEFILGALIGMGVAALAYRSRFGLSLAWRAGVYAGLAFLICAVIGGWARAHEGFHNGSPIDIGLSGENLSLRNRIAEHELMLRVGSSVAAGLLAGLCHRKPKGRGTASIMR